MSLTFNQLSSAALRVCEDDAPLPLHPRAFRDIAVGAGIVIGFFGLFGGWAALAPLDAATVASGALIVDGHRQSVQSRDGGVISSLPVKDGDHVRYGQVLVGLAVADAQASERSLASRVIRRQAEIARLNAEQRGVTVIPAPLEFASYGGVDQADAVAALKSAQAELDTQHRADLTRHGVLRARLTQAQDQVDGVRMQARSNAQQQVLNGQELKGLKELAAQGYAPLTRVRELERSAASLMGDAGAETAEMARLQAVAGETRMQEAQGDSERAQAVAQDLRMAEADLQVLLPQWKAAREELARSVIRAPSSGRVVGLTVNTIGGVVAPGQRLMEIAPDQAHLVVEARVSPKEAVQLRVGEPARMRFSSTSAASPREVSGLIEKLSADVLTDERTGTAFYLMDVAAETHPGQAKSELAQVGRLGQAVQIMVTGRKRSALQYWLEPLTQRLWRNFHED